MTLVEIAGGFIAGLITGVGVSIFYLRWKVRSQLGAMQGQMEEMMDMTQGLEDFEAPVHEEPGSEKASDSDSEDE